MDRFPSYESSFYKKIEEMNLDDKLRNFTDFYSSFWKIVYYSYNDFSKFRGQFSDDYKNNYIRKIHTTFIKILPHINSDYEQIIHDEIFPFVNNTSDQELKLPYMRI